MTSSMHAVQNETESRLNTLEQGTTRLTSGSAYVYLDPDTGGTVVQEQLDWTAAAGGWESYSTVSPLIDDVTGGEMSTDYGMAEAHLLGAMGVLSGMVRRKTGATPNPLAAGTRYNLPMFGLPLDWRPTYNVILPCLCGNADPAASSTNAFGTAWIELRPEYSPFQISGRAYFVTANLALSPSTGWIALQGIFPCLSVSRDEGLAINSWDDVAMTPTWDDIDPDVTWNSYP